MLGSEGQAPICCGLAVALPWSAVVAAGERPWSPWACLSGNEDAQPD